MLSSVLRLCCIVSMFRDRAVSFRCFAFALLGLGVPLPCCSARAIAVRLYRCGVREVCGGGDVLLEEGGMNAACLFVRRPSLCGLRFFEASIVCLKNRKFGNIV